MTPEEFKARMEVIAFKWKACPDTLHAQADDLICELLRSLGYGEGVEVFEAQEKWYS